MNPTTELTESCPEYWITEEDMDEEEDEMDALIW